METDQNYKEASQLYENQAKRAIVAEMDVKRELSS